MVMTPFIDSGNLQDLLCDRRNARVCLYIVIIAVFLYCAYGTSLLYQQLDRDTKLKLAIQVCQALVYLHSCTPPLVHRDLTPANILVRSRDRLHSRLEIIASLRSATIFWRYKANLKLLPIMRQGGVGVRTCTGFKSFLGFCLP